MKIALISIGMAMLCTLVMCDIEYEKIFKKCQNSHGITDKELETLDINGLDPTNIATKFKLGLYCIAKEAEFFLDNGEFNFDSSMFEGANEEQRKALEECKDNADGNNANICGDGDGDDNGNYSEDEIKQCNKLWVFAQCFHDKFNMEN